MRNKLERFAENAERRNVVEPGKPVFLSIKGHWGEFFENDYPMTLELGCGHGEYTVGLAAMYPQRNFIGVDVKGARIWKGSSQAEEQGLSNVAFLRIRILDLEESVAEAETSEIWITFPDPRPKDRDEKRRLTAPRFLDMYKRVLQPGGRVSRMTRSRPTPTRSPRPSARSATRAKSNRVTATCRCAPPTRRSGRSIVTSTRRSGSAGRSWASRCGCRPRRCTGSSTSAATKCTGCRG